MANVISIFVGASKDLFGAYSENCPGIYAEGESLEECKKEVYNAIELIKAELPEEQWPEPLKAEFSIEWHYDVQSILMHFSSIVSLSGLQRMTGINQKQLWAYMHGLRKPRPDNVMRIQNAFRKLGADLVNVQLT